MVDTQYCTHCTTKFCIITTLMLKKFDHVLDRVSNKYVYIVNYYRSDAFLTYCIAPYKYLH